MPGDRVKDATINCHDNMNINKINNNINNNNIHIPAMQGYQVKYTNINYQDSIDKSNTKNKSSTLAWQDEDNNIKTQCIYMESKIYLPIYVVPLTWLLEL